MKYFGTDGIRDRIDGPLMAPDFVYYFGRAIGRWLVSRRTSPSASLHVIIGRDTRASGSSLLTELCRGLSSEGVKIFDASISPTPAIAFAVREMRLDAGIVITASHNPATDNGLKVFGPDGTKLSANDEEMIEALLEKVMRSQRSRTSPPAVMQYDARRHYVEHHSRLLDEKALFGLRIVVDSSNGATFRTTGEVLERYGASVIRIGCEPSGDNINSKVGSEFPTVLSAAVLRNGADLGIAHDGDGDRVILCDQKGAIIDGDAVLAILGTAWAARNELPHKRVVATVMSNLGLDHCLRHAGVQLLRTDVGDRHVFFEMQRSGAMLGGESSGHFIAARYMPTGDGLLAALLVLKEMMLKCVPLADLSACFRPFCQLKKNLPVKLKPALESHLPLQTELSNLVVQLGDHGRILLRYSGTEPKIRLLAEAADADLAEATLAQLEAIVARHLDLL